jgi:hypothetical protein
VQSLHEQKHLRHEILPASVYSALPGQIQSGWGGSSLLSGKLLKNHSKDRSMVFLAVNPP